MRRRALLATMAAGAGGVAGCLSTPSGDDGNSTDSGDDTGDPPGSDGSESDGDSDGEGSDPGGDPGNPGEPPEPPEPPERMASVVEFETAPRTYAFAPVHRRTDDDTNVALWFDRTASPEAPARLTGWLRNENEYENTVDLEWLPAVGDVHSATVTVGDTHSSISLAPTENNDLAETVPEPVRADDGRWRTADPGPWVAEHVTLAPGEWVELEYLVLGSPDMPADASGTFEFRGPDRDARITVWDSEEPGPTVESRFAGRSVPPLSEEATTAWFHDADPTTAVSLEPDHERVELDGAVSFELVNNSDEMLRCGHWNLHKLVDGEWFHLGPFVHTSDCRGMAPGERVDWTLRAFNGEAVRCDCDAAGGACAGGMTRGHLGGGIYGVVAGYGHPADESGALVELVGDPASITLTDDATLDRDGAEVVVTTAAHGDGEHPPDATLTLERVADPGGDDGERLLAEQLLAEPGFPGRSIALRNGVAAFDSGVERVVVRTDEHAAEGAVGHDRSERRIRVRGRTYDVTAELPESS